MSRIYIDHFLRKYTLLFFLILQSLCKDRLSSQKRFTHNLKVTKLYSYIEVNEKELFCHVPYAQFPQNCTEKKRSSKNEYWFYDHIEKVTVTA